MSQLSEIRTRYMQDALPVRLGGLAANLARVTSFSLSQANPAIVDSLLNESKFFIEWAAPEATLDVQVPLVELQRLLIHWQGDWSQKKTETSWRQELAEQARAWSDRVLEMSGLLDETPDEA